MQLPPHRCFVQYHFAYKIHPNGNFPFVPEVDTSLDTWQWIVTWRLDTSVLPGDLILESHLETAWGREGQGTELDTVPGVSPTWRLHTVLCCTLYSAALWTLLHSVLWTCNTAHVFTVLCWTLHTAHCMLQSSNLTCYTEYVILYSVIYYTLQTAHCKAHTEHVTLQTAQCKCKIAHCTLHCTLNIAPGTRHTVYYTLNTAQWTMHLLHCTLHTTHCTLHTVGCKLHWSPTLSVAESLYLLGLADTPLLLPCTLHLKLHFTLHTIHCTLHTAHCTLQYTWLGMATETGWWGGWWLTLPGREGRRHRV